MCTHDYSPPLPQIKVSPPTAALYHHHNRHFAHHALSLSSVIPLPTHPSHTRTHLPTAADTRKRSYLIIITNVVRRRRQSSEDNQSVDRRFPLQERVYHTFEFLTAFEVSHRILFVFFFFSFERNHFLRFRHRRPTIKRSVQHILSGLLCAGGDSSPDSTSSYNETSKFFV